jgi:hypothetical protein
MAVPRRRPRDRLFPQTAERAPPWRAVARRRPGSIRIYRCSRGDAPSSARQPLADFREQMPGLMAHNLHDDHGQHDRDQSDPVHRRPAQPAPTANISRQRRQFPTPGSNQSRPAPPRHVLLGLSIAPKGASARMGPAARAAIPCSFEVEREQRRSGWRGRSVIVQWLRSEPKLWVREYGGDVAKW